MIFIKNVEDLRLQSLSNVKEISFDNRRYRRIQITGETGHVFYCEAERQIIKVKAAQIRVEYIILTKVGIDQYSLGNLAN